MSRDWEQCKCGLVTQDGGYEQEMGEDKEGCDEEQEENRGLEEQQEEG